MEGNRKQIKKTGNGNKVLIPVDFSAKGSLALNVGFELAGRIGQDVTLIHASVVPDPTLAPQFPDDFNGMDNESAEIEEMEIDEEVHSMDLKSMGKLKKNIESRQKDGTLPQIAFETVIAPGMPEEVISEYCVVTPPAVVVMATRGREKRLEDLVGSVTAEVIDHCVAPVLTVPEDYTFAGFKEIVRICAFCHGDDGDLEAIDYLMRMFDNPEVVVYLFPATDKQKGEKREIALNSLKTRLEKLYPGSVFKIDESALAHNLREEAESMFRREKIQMILAPNRKRNAISRFFNPGLAHKILYEIDFPMMAIPV